MVGPEAALAAASGPACAPGLAGVFCAGGGALELVCAHANGAPAATASAAAAARGVRREARRENIIGAPSMWDRRRCGAATSVPARPAIETHRPSRAASDQGPGDGLMRIETVDFAVSFATLSSLFCAHSQSDAAAARRMARRLDRRGSLRIGIADTPPRAYELPLSESAPTSNAGAQPCCIT